MDRMTPTVRRRHGTTFAADAPEGDRPGRCRGHSGRWLWAALAVVLLGCSPSEPDVEAQTARGEELYAAHCIECHGGATGGSISDIPPRHNAEGHTWHHGDCQLVDIIRDGMPPRTGYPTMPAFSDELEEHDIEAILAYIKTWWESDQLQHQEVVTEQVCDQ